LKDLSKYKVLVLAGQECLSDEKLDLIRNLSKRSGLVATGNTSLYTEWRQRKKDFGLNDLFQFPAPEGGIRRQFADIPFTQKQIGSGKVVYIPAVRLLSLNLLQSHDQPLLEASSQLKRTDRIWWTWASGNSLSLKIEAPQTVTMELIKKKITVL